MPLSLYTYGPFLFLWVVFIEVINLSSFRTDFFWLYVFACEGNELVLKVRHGN